MSLQLISQYYDQVFPNIQKTFIGEGQWQKLVIETCKLFQFYRVLDLFLLFLEHTAFFLEYALEIICVAFTKNKRKIYQGLWKNQVSILRPCSRMLSNIS